jgi:hypothetical protein
MEHEHSKPAMYRTLVGFQHAVPEAVHAGSAINGVRSSATNLGTLEIGNGKKQGALTAVSRAIKSYWISRVANAEKFSRKRGTRFEVLGCFGLMLFLGLISPGNAQESPAFLGVPIMQANRNNLTKSILANKGQRKTAVKKGEVEAPPIEDYIFPEGLLPSGIRWVRFYFDDNNQLIMLEAKVPTKSILERKKDDTAESEMMRLLEQKYGPAQRVKDFKNPLGMISQEYSWHFQDLSSIVLGSDSVLKGQTVKYVNKRLFARQKSQTENDQSKKF